MSGPGGSKLVGGTALGASGDGLLRGPDAADVDGAVDDEAVLGAGVAVLALVLVGAAG